MVQLINNLKTTPAVPSFISFADKRRSMLFVTVTELLEYSHLLTTLLQFYLHGLEHIYISIVYILYKLYYSRVFHLHFSGSFSLYSKQNVFSFTKQSKCCCQFIYFIKTRLSKRRKSVFISQEILFSGNNSGNSAVSSTLQ